MTAQTLHTARLAQWLRYNGQRGTEKQIARLARMFPASQTATVCRMLAERNIVPAGCTSTALDYAALAAEVTL